MVVETGDETEEELEALKLKKDKVKTRSEMETEGLILAMSDIDGRAFIWSILDEAGFMQLVSPDSVETVNLATRLYGRIVEATSIELATQMIRENTA
jgi:hypothetical protein